MTQLWANVPYLECPGCLFVTKKMHLDIFQFPNLPGLGLELQEHGDELLGILGDMSPVLGLKLVHASGKAARILG